MIGAPGVEADGFPRNGDRIAALDGLRGIAILVVLFHNTAFILQTSTQLLTKLAGALGAAGWIGVQVFFVLSGFLITGLLLESRGRPDFFRTFYLRRTLRIFPLYYAFLIGALVALPLLADIPAWTATARQNQWWFWTYTANWGIPFGHDIPGLSHFWSLAVEEQFYLLWPLVVFALSARPLLAACLLLVVTAPLIRWALLAAGLPELASYQFTIARWDALALGSALAVLVREPASRRWLDRHMGWICLATIAALMGFLLFERGFHDKDPEVQVYGQSLVALLFGALVFFGAAGSSSASRTFQRVLAARWLRFFGKYSYAIYVFHYPIHRLVSGSFSSVVNGPDTPWRVVRLGAYVIGVAAVSVILALISWRILEKPFLDMKDRITPRRPAAPQAGPA